MLRAMLWALQASPRLPCTFWPDASFTLLGVQGQCTYNSGAPVLALLRPLAILLEGLVDVKWKHCRAHRGHPWNELADALAETERVVSISGGNMKSEKASFSRATRRPVVR